ncbi:PTS mannitol transporter subunit IICBA [Cardiobacterium hominis]|uniref:PTS mannitol transporter subunit IICBA n=1 Tax=Cardiobacterium hominis TaxID=2718 RepID=UPI0028E6D46E|nr:PTS mannitol transporter subunit IICBA [Cardiobacterium hominis]
MFSESAKLKVQRFGRFLSNMVMPNIGAFIAWGLITALFIKTGWFPVAALGGFSDDAALQQAIARFVQDISGNLINYQQISATFLHVVTTYDQYLGKGIVGPMITYLLPLLIGYTGGKLAGGDRGAVVGAITTMGVIVGSDIPMFLGAMIVGPLGGWAIKTFDRAVDGKIKSGFEMLVNNFSAGIIGMLLALLAFVVIGPAAKGLSGALAAGVDFLVKHDLLPLTSIFVEPAKILFLNNAINHGIFSPLGIAQSQEVGRSIFFLIEANPGPGLGVLLAYLLLGKGSAKQTAGGAAIIHFFGGIHEIYFPYVLMNPRLLLAVIAGGMTGVFTLVFMHGGLISPASPGSIFAVLAMTPKGGYAAVLCAVAASCVVSFLVASVFVRRMPASGDEELSAARDKMQSLKLATGTDAHQFDDVKTVYVACDAGMGSSATGASILRKKVQEAGLDIAVKNCAINDLPEDARMVITHQDLTARAQAYRPDALHFSLQNFLDRAFYDQIVAKLKVGHHPPQAAESKAKGSSAPRYTFGLEQIFLGRRALSKEEAIRFAGRKLVEGGFVTPDYVEAMITRENDSSTYLGEGIAIPHGTLVAKDAVLKTGIVFCQYPEGVSFSNDPNEKAYLVIGIAAQNNEHIGVIAALTNALDSEADIEMLKNTSDPQAVLDILSR